MLTQDQVCRKSIVLLRRYYLIKDLKKRELAMWLSGEKFSRQRYKIPKLEACLG